MELLAKIIGSAIVVVLVVLSLLGMVALATALPALVLWIAWGLSGADLFNFHLSFVEVWASIVVVGVLRNVLVNGLVPKETVQRATTSLMK